MYFTPGWARINKLFYRFEGGGVSDELIEDRAASPYIGIAFSFH
jgi:hypothetical protein